MTREMTSKEKDLISIIFLTRTEGCPLPFALVREQDHTGVSGTGTVAYGVQFEDGTVVIRWGGENPSTVVWDSLERAKAVHGHGGSTRFVWLAERVEDLAEIERRMEHAEAAIARVRELHTDSPAGPCPICYRAEDAAKDPDDDGLVNYPCPTVQAVCPGCVELGGPCDLHFPKGSRAFAEHDDTDRGQQ